MVTYPCCTCCSHLITQYRTGHAIPCPNPDCANQMRETTIQAQCEHRANHAAYATPVMRAMGLELIRCTCGLKRAAKIQEARN